MNTARRRLFLLVLLLMIPVMGVLILGGWSDLNQNLENHRKELARLSSRAQGNFNNMVEKARSVFTELIRVNEMRSPDNCTLIYNDLRFAYERLAPAVDNLMLANAHGDIYCAVNPVQGMKNVSGQPYFQQALRKLDLALGEYVPNSIIGTPIVTMAYPVLSLDGKPQTVILATYSTQWLESWQSEGNLPSGSTLTLTSAAGHVLQRWKDGKTVEFGAQSIPRAWLEGTQAAPSVHESADLDGTRRLNTITVLGQGTQSSAYLHLGYPVEEMYAQFFQSLRWKIAILIFTFLGAMLLAWWSSESWFLQPLNQLMVAVTQLQAGDLAVRAEIRHAKGGALSEITQLAHAFNRMADALQQRESERQQSEARFRAAFDSSAIGIGLLSLDGNILQVNAAVCKMSGFTEAELLQRNDRQNVHPEDANIGMDLFNEMLAGKREHYSVERRYLLKNGGYIWTRLTLSVVRSADGQPAYLVGMIEDIDEQKRILANLLESEARFRAVYENAAIGISLVAANRQVLTVNPALITMSGYSEEELKKLGGLAITYPEDRAIGQAEYQEVLEGKRASYQVEKRYVHRDGQAHWMRQTVSAVRDQHGQLVYLVAIAEDIDGQKRAIEELRESEARFRAMFDSAAVGVAVMTLDRHIVQINQRAMYLTGYTPEEIGEIDPSNLALEEDRYLDRDLFQELAEGKRSQYTVEKRYIRKDGTIFWGRVNFAAVPDAKGNPLYTIGIIEDITEEKEAAKTLAESEARFRTLYDSAEMGIVLVDLGSEGSLPLDETRFNHLVANQRLNPAMQRMFGYTAEEMKGIAVANLIDPEDQGIDRQEFRQLLTGEIDSFRSEKRFVRKDGSLFWGRLTDSLARTADGTPRMVIGIIEDISEERRAAERLAAQEAEYRRMLEQRISERTIELQQVNSLLQQKAAQEAVTAERTRLARDLHDAVTQTLFSTTLIADVLPDIWEMNPGEGKRRLEEVRQLTRGALAEMRTLLVELRPNALVEVPLPTLLRQLTEAMIGRSRIDIQLNTEGDRRLPADVQVGLYRIAQEALNNIFKHAKASHAVVTLRLASPVRLTIADDGKGFDPKVVTADHLGLKIMLERAEAIGARVSIEAEPGEGTQISVVWQDSRASS